MGMQQVIMGATGTASIVATNGAGFYVTGVKLEIGSVATPYNRQSLAKSMADCQRYYQKARGRWCRCMAILRQEFNSGFYWSVPVCDARCSNDDYG